MRAGGRSGFQPLGCARTRWPPDEGEPLGNSGQLGNVVSQGSDGSPGNGGNGPPGHNRYIEEQIENMDSRKYLRILKESKNMGFSFDFIKSWDGWLVRTPDNIKCVLKPSGDQESMEISVGIMEIIELYEIAESEEVGAVFFGPQTFLEIEDANEGVVLRVNDNLTIETAYDELYSETADLLRESFKSLDSQGDVAQRKSQFQTYETVAEVYDELMTDSGDNE